jgi:hypothetical protein
VVEALGRLGRGAGGERLIALLQRHAPTWLVQLPAFLRPADYDALQRQTQGTTRERMLQELAEALEALTAERPLLLVLEDLQWSDPSTLDLLSMVARRSEPARLLILGTYSGWEPKEAGTLLVLQRDLAFRPAFSIGKSKALADFDHKKARRKRRKINQVSL